MPSTGGLIGGSVATGLEIKMADAKANIIFLPLNLFYAKAV